MLVNDGAWDVTVETQMLLLLCYFCFIVLTRIEGYVWGGPVVDVR